MYLNLYRCLKCNNMWSAVQECKTDVCKCGKISKAYSSTEGALKNEGFSDRPKGTNGNGS